MVSSLVKDYITKHAIGSECLFKDWTSFLKLLYAENGRVSAILWWDYCKRTQQQDSVGMGGYTDPENPEYMYAETQAYEDGLETKTLDEIMEYIRLVKADGIRYGSKYKSHELVPSFFLAE